MPYCSSCGSQIPDGQGSSCSMCMGVMGWGSDGYYEDWAEKQIQKEIEQKQTEERYMQEELEKEALKQQKIEEERELLDTFYHYYMASRHEGKTRQESINEFLKERHETE